jgi:hypothetical protein
MSLFSKAELVAAMPEATQHLALDDGDDGQQVDAIFAAVLAEAEAWIGGYLQQAGLELADPPHERLKHAGLKYAEYTLWNRRGHAERAKQVYEQWIEPAMEWLARVARREESLTPDDEALTPPGAIVETMRSYPTDGRLPV